MNYAEKEIEEMMLEMAEERAEWLKILEAEAYARMDDEWR